MSSHASSPAPDAQALPWWQGAAIYQIYPRSFRDTNGDGIGDLPGITSGLDHVASLGVDAVWISPFFTSPMRDFGYDVADYCDVDPIFGTLSDFDALVTRAHELGLKVLIDQVYSHTSDDHAWFAESRASRDNPKADWYVWRDAKPDGSPPTNWQSVFGGPAWTWDARRGQYYLHNFLASQPQLNGHNPDVQQALLDVAKFWLDRGVDGFRIDAINFSMHDPEFRDNPPAPPTDKPRTRPFDFQLKTYNQSHRDIPLFLERLRSLADRYDATFTLAEVGGDEALVEMKSFTQGDARLNSAYGFDFLYADKLTPQLVCRALGDWPGQPGEGWPSWAFENHDAPRAVSRWAAPEHRTAFLRCKMALLAALRGNIIVYQGEELGLTQVDIPFEQLQDPEAIANWPLTLSRDGVRTPLPWAGDAPDMGFGSAEPWLPASEDHRPLAIDRQEADDASLLHFTRDVLALRNGHPALHHGALERCRASAALLSFDRVADGERIRCLFNLSDQTIDTADAAGSPIFAVNAADTDTLPPYGALFLSC
ncbi:alpha-amylase family glycosyl hydrolase [Alteriqipengyuania flavescens]|uniref:alpha-amylase family glycosyl hydrolase n=1 Tax=Alteriqipengyuania flavescens TaxID=3053610 RepID=UPI0025B36C21|nr:alpha-amylase family glycosyl hydrolase [Alteriqipengyuania flavescens]WJY19044.1 alpha-amylase family glycosyl hydrolase [Alteriqipengyuania flavescens]WJY24984.1 alpha-amylase family glycosyl hydrolase [Alteriqipengyuania flavescens]